MFNKNFKLIIAALVIAFAVYQFIEGYLANGIALILLSFIFIFLYFKNECIILAFFQMRKQNLESTERWLEKIKNPQSALIRKQQAYYHFLFGVIYMSKNLNLAEKYFKKALKIGLRMRYDIAMAKLSLAGIYTQKRRKREAKKLLQEAKKLDKDQMLTQQVKVMEQQLRKI